MGTGRITTIGFVVACAIVAGRFPVNAQVIFANGMAQNSDDNSQKGFSVHKDSQTVSETIEDFERYRDKKAWEKAIGAFNKLVDQKPTGLVPDKDGFYVASSQKVQSELLSLPADGREAYRLFNDAKAEQMLRDAVTHSTDTTGGKTATGETTAEADPDNIRALEEIVQRYFITSAGDRAADRLGDAFFETGDFDNAARCWRLIIDNYPDTNLSPLMLQTKLAVALARAGRWPEFEIVRGKIHDRYSGQTATIGGRDVIASEYIDTLAKDQSPTTAPSESAGGLSTSTFVDASKTPLKFPASDTPAWQIPLMDAQMNKQIETGFQQFGWMVLAGRIENTIPATAVDDKRIYVNWFGSCFAADLQTGKMLWRTNGLKDFAQSAAQAAMQGMSTNFNTFSVALAGDRVLFVRKDIAPQQVPNWLICVNAADGKNLWTTANGSLSDTYFLGQPIVDGDAVYVCAHTTSNQELSLYCLGLEKGDVRWSVVLGTPTLTTDFRGQPEEQVPALFQYQRKIFVLTNNGAVIEVNPRSKAIEWAFTHETNAPQGRQMFYYNQSSPPDMDSPGSFITRNSLLYMKERGGENVYLLDLSGPTLVWKRPLDPTVALVSCDDDHLWVAGSDLDCIDLHSKAMQWSDKLSTGIGSIRPILAAGHLYVFGQRGVHDITTETGDAAPMFRGYDRDGLGGILWQTKNLLISVSSTAITAYSTGGGENH